MTVGASNIINEPLVDREKIIFPPLHIKLGLMKQFLRALECFKYICRFFPRLSMEKLKAGIFSGPQIHQIIKDDNFINSMTDIEAVSYTHLRAHETPEHLVC